MRFGPKTSGSREPVPDEPPPSLLLHPATSATSTASPASVAGRPSDRACGRVVVILTRLARRLHQRGIPADTQSTTCTVTDRPATVHGGRGESAGRPRGSGGLIPHGQTLPVG